MSLFGTLMSKIFPSNHPAVAQASNAPGQQPAATAAPQQATQSATGAAAAPAASAQRPMAAQPVDVEQILNDKARNNAEKLNWRTSIVDLMKLVGMDSSLNARKSLAQELHYTGDTNDSAAMNIWLHKQVMTKLAENGGKVPDDLKH
jgi:hypothetical protein